MFLTEEEIQNLTGYKMFSLQIKWLRQNGIKYLVGGDKKPRVLKLHIEQIFGLHDKPKKRRAEPNVEGLLKWQNERRK